MSDDVRLFPYLLRFANGYIVAVIAVGILMQLLGLQSGVASSIASLVAGVGVAAFKFVGDQRRLPSRRERWRLTLGCLAASFLLSIVIFVALVAAAGELAQMSQAAGRIADARTALIFTVVTLFVLALHGVVIWFLYGTFSRTAYKSRVDNRPSA